MIVTDAGEDPDYQWGDLACLMQQVREDFGAEIEWLDLKAARVQVDAEALKRAKPITGADAPAEEDKPESQRRRERWQSILAAYSQEKIGLCEWIQAWIDPDKLDTLANIKREGQSSAAFAQVTYPDGPKSWILLLKPSLSPGLKQDILNYAATNSKFPQDPTFDQVFDDIQWESYRALGQQIADQVFQPRPQPNRL